MAIVGNTRIAQRFLRSVRIDADLGDAGALDGFVCPQSSKDVLLSMARHVRETEQGAFTWTGPYGGGKSSLVVALSALLGGSSAERKRAEAVFGAKCSRRMTEALPPGAKGWHIVPVVGRRDDPVRAIGEALQATGIASRQPRGGWNEGKLLATITEAAASKPKSHGGVIMFIDEMGKFLEAAAQRGADVYVFQQLAEAAARSKGRLIIVGVLHQAFEEYAHRLSREIRDEWSKIQGRFLDLPINAAGDEQIELISRAIESGRRPEEKEKRISLAVAKLARRDRPADAAPLARMLEKCWPLHPVVACLLGPMSRRGFGQNQRSIFGFLNSAEPFGFKEIIGGGGNLYAPSHLWDYLRANLEPSILASPDGHRWSLAADALERCEAAGGDARHLRVLKTIAVIDLFKERSGLVPGFKTLRASLPDLEKKDLEDDLLRLERWSLVVFRKFRDSYAIFAGSDFNMERASQAALENGGEIDFEVIKRLASIQPILAKRHYHETGTLRWFDMEIASVGDIAKLAAEHEPPSGTAGRFVLAVPTGGETEKQARDLCRKAARGERDWDLVVGFSLNSWSIVRLARELMAMERVQNDHPDLIGDAVARREVTARVTALQDQLDAELHKSFHDAEWVRGDAHHGKSHYGKVYGFAGLSALASDLADERFNQAPELHNELLNRQKPSGPAVGAQNALLRRMVGNEGQPRLGIDGFPAEGGLLASMLDDPGLYVDRRADGWNFTTPKGKDPRRLKPIWDEAANFLRANKSRSVSLSELYDRWRRPPFGVKDGLMPVLAVAFILSRRDKIALYREGLFRARIEEIDVEYLAKDAGTIQLRWMDMSQAVRRLLSDMADVVRAINPSNSLGNLEPIDVARGLVAIHHELPSWTKRTLKLSKNAVKIRDIFKLAKDPNKLLFDDLPPAVVGKSASSTEKGMRKAVAAVREGLEELVHAYPTMMKRLRDQMLEELQVPNLSPSSLVELRKRAENVRQLAGDFHLEAFIGRLSQFDEKPETFEGIASLAANKPPRDWIDLDHDRAMIDIADMSQKFLRAEAFARVKGRPQKRQAMAVVIGMDGRPVPFHEEFDLADSDRSTVDDLVERIAETIGDTNHDRKSIILPALAEITARVIRGEGIMTESPKLERAS